MLATEQGGGGIKSAPPSGACVQVAGRASPVFHMHALY